MIKFVFAFTNYRSFPKSGILFRKNFNFLVICYTHTNFSLHFQIVQVAWILSIVIIGINIYFFCNTFISWLVHSELPRIVSAIISTLVFPFMGAYITALIYLAFRKVNAASLFPSVSVSSGTEVESWRQAGNVDDIGVR